MKRNPIVLISALVIAITSSAYIVKDSNGKASYSGAPGDFGTCANCHSGGSGPTSVSISITPTLDPGNIYTPGATYTIDVQVSNSNLNSYGFCAVVLNGTTAASANSGTLSLPGAGVKIVNGNLGRRNATHTTPKAGTGNAIFSFVWTAPLSSTMSAIYAAGNAVNGNSSFSGDVVGTGSLLMYPSSATGMLADNIAVQGLKIYPNPASEQLTIRYKLNQASDVKIELYTIKGQLAATLVHESQSHGIYNKEILLPSIISSGVYFLKISSNGENVAQRLVSIN